MLMHYNDHICNKNNCTDIEGIHKKNIFQKTKGKGNIRSTNLCVEFHQRKLKRTLHFSGSTRLSLAIKESITT